MLGSSAVGLEDYWYIACRSKELRRTKPRAATLLDRPVVLFRDSEGRPGALEDRCAHRNAPLSKGEVCRSKGTLQCPYHGWRYGRDGRVAEVPALPSGEKPDQKLHITAYPCVEQDGYIWISLSEKPKVPAPLRFPHLGEKGWTAFHMKTLFHASVDSCLENFLDCPHATYVHNHWFRAPTGRPVSAKVRNLRDGVIAEYFEEPRERALVWWLLSKNRSKMKHTDRFIAPSTSRVDYVFSDKRHYIITSSCSPISEKKTLVYTVMNFKVRPIGPLIRLFFEPLSKQIIKQDVKMLDLQQANIDRYGKTQYRYINPDLLGPGIFNWRNAIRHDEPPPPEGRERDVDLTL